jgi:predicted enzyme related to lactoylglutathione lyase
MAKNLKNGFVFHELMTTDVEGAKNFYQEITGLTVTPGPYPMLMDNRQPVAGLVGPRADGSAWPSGGPESHWIAYFSVNDVDATAPGFGRAAVLRDPQGAAFGIFTQLK